MEAEKLELLRYPLGKFQEPANYTPESIKQCIGDLIELPKLCKTEILLFTDEMLDVSYKPSGWTARQLVHHLVDSHLNAYIRFKLSLTEELPVIKPYNESLWADLPDSRLADVEDSLFLLDVLHRRFVLLLNNMTEMDFNRCYYHPGYEKKFTLKAALALYAWHGKHHLEHIRIVKRKFASSEK